MRYPDTARWTLTKNEERIKMRPRGKDKRECGPCPDSRLVVEQDFQPQGVAADSRLQPYEHSELRRCPCSSLRTCRHYTCTHPTNSILQASSSIPITYFQQIRATPSTLQTSKNKQSCERDEHLQENRAMPTSIPPQMQNCPYSHYYSQRLR